MGSSKVVLPAMILMDVADRLDDQLQGLTTDCMPMGDPNPVAGAVLQMSKRLYEVKDRSGTASWRDLEVVAGNYHKSLAADTPEFREALIQHMATITAMVMDWDRHHAAGEH